MSKEDFIRLYTKFSVVIGLILFIFVAAFIGRFPEGKVLLENGIFGVNVLVFGSGFAIVNTPLIIFITLFILNIYMLIRVGSTEEIPFKELQSVVFTNTFLVFLMIIGQIAFVLMLPDSINGEIINRFFMITFHIGTGSAYHVIYVNYTLTFIYFIYNILVLVKSPLPKPEEEPEIYTNNDMETLVEETVEESDEK